MATTDKKVVTLSIRLTETVRAKLLSLCAVSAPGGMSQSALIARLINAEAKRQKVPEQNKRNKNEKADTPAYR